MSNEEKEKTILTVGKVILRIVIALLIMFLGACLKYAGSNDTGNALGQDYLILSGQMLTLFGLVYLFSKNKKNIEEMPINNSIIGYKGKIGRKKYFINSSIYILVLVIVGVVINYISNSNNEKSSILGIIYLIFFIVIYVISMCNDKRRISDVRGTSSASLWNSIFISLFFIPITKIIAIVLLSILPSYSSETIWQRIKTFINRIKTYKQFNGIMEAPVVHFILSKKETFVKIIFKALNVVAFLIAFLFVRACTAGFHDSVNHHATEGITNNSSIATSNLSKKQLLNDASKVRGFIGVNTDLLEYYCKDSGYIPYKYINAFEKRFTKTISNMNNIVNTYSNPHTEELLTKKIRVETNAMFDAQLKEFQKNYDINKYDFCKIFDDEEEMKSRIEEKVQTFKDYMPNYFLD